MVRTVAVLALLAPVLASAEPQAQAQALLEFELEAGEPHVGEQVIATVRLYGTARLLTSALTDPVSDRAVVKPLAEGMASRVVRGGVSYDVFERRYAVFPLRAGAVTVKAPTFKGFFSLLDGPDLPLGGKLPTGPIREVRATAPDRTLRVLAASDAVTPWLPASRVELVESVDPPDGPYVAGRAFRRRIELVAHGQLHTAIPPPVIAYPESLEALPDALDAATETTDSGVVARWRQQWALIPRQEGEVILPPVTVRWWDTRLRQVREASIGRRTLQVASPASAPARTDATVAAPPASQHMGWLVAAAVAWLGWATTAVAWWRQRAGARPGPTRENVPAQSRRAAAAELRRVLEGGDALAARAAIVRWARACLPEARLSSLASIADAARSDALRLQLRALDRALYGAGGTWDPAQLHRALTAMDGRRTATSQPTALPPLYVEAEPEQDEAPASTRWRWAWVIAVAGLAGILAAGLFARPGSKALDVEAYRGLLATQQAPVLDFLRAFERAQDQLHPARIAALQAELRAASGIAVARARAELDAIQPPDELRDLHARWSAAVAALDDARRLFVDAGPREFVAAFFRSRERFLAATFGLYEIRGELPGLGRYWLLDDAAEIQDAPTAAPVPVGVLDRDAAAEHSAFALYVPEYYEPTRRWPLLVALHGSHGSGRGALATWLRIARSRGWIVVAPKSRDASWELEAPAADVAGIMGAVRAVQRTYSIDAGRVFLSGLSDGGTFGYLAGARCPDAFAGVVPIAAVLPPGLDLSAARRLPVLVAHGEEDWMFPVEGARAALAVLVAAGFQDATLITVPGWGHGLNVAVNQRHVLPWLERRSRNAVEPGFCPGLSARQDTP